LLTCTEHEDQQLLVLGAGFESYKTISNINRVYLVDLPSIIAERRAKSDIDSEKCILIAADITSADFMDILISFGFDISVKTIVIAESVFSYLEESRLKSLLETLSKSLMQAAMVVYDVTVPVGSGGYSSSTKACFDRSRATIKSAHISTVDAARFYCGAGWVFVVSFTVQQAISALCPEVSMMRAIDAEPFDEFSSLALLNKQYSLTVCSVSSSYMKTFLTSANICNFDVRSFCC
jgi:O-methyltransferase involved in polyketide biosynthesis